MKPTRPRSCLSVGSILCLAVFHMGAAGVASCADEQPLNVVFILADDLGWADTTLYGHTSLYKTPNLARLAQRGMVFNRAYANSPLCSPTRASILTGQTPARHGSTAPVHHTGEVRLKASVSKSAPPGNKALQTDSVTRLDTAFPTLGKLLKQAGYATGHFGKWHLGPEPYSPLEHGFDVDLPHHSGPGPAGSFVAPWKFKRFKANYPKEHIEDRMAQEAVTWMKSVKTKPFLMHYWQFSVHAPFDAKQALIDRYRKEIDPDDPQRSPTYAAMVHSLDDAVGTLLDAVDAAGIADRTAIVFTSDNGGNMYNEVDGTTPTSNAPLRGGKATLFEGGIRVPCVVVWPGVTKPGSRSDEIIQASDFYTTILSQLKVPMPGDHVVDGIDLTPALRGGSLDRQGIFTYFPHSPPVPDWLPPAMSIHSGDWKLIRLFHQGKEGAHDYLLYNLKSDIGECNNVAADHPETVATLDRMMESYIHEADVVIPRPNPAFDPSKYRPEQVGVPRSRKKAAPAIDGWTARGTCTIKKTGGILGIDSTGGDPYVTANPFKSRSDGPFTVRLRIKSTAAGDGAVYYGTPPSPKRMATFKVNHDGAWHEYAVGIPVEDLNGLRVDPARGAGNIEIDWIRIENASGRRIREWGF